MDELVGLIEGADRILTFDRSVWLGGTALYLMLLAERADRGLGNWHMAKRQRRPGATSAAARRYLWPRSQV
jgi:hypothetical protein